jgi:hypothetical protein
MFSMSNVVIATVVNLDTLNCLGECVRLTRKRMNISLRSFYISHGQASASVRLNWCFLGVQQPRQRLYRHKVYRDT